MRPHPYATATQPVPRSSEKDAATFLTHALPRPRMARFLALALVAAVLVLPAVHAQVPTTPTVTVKVTLPPGPAVVPLGSAGNVTVTVDFTINNVACPQAGLPAGGTPGTATVKLTSADKPSPLQGIASTVTPQTVTFSLNQPQYASTPYQGTATATLAYAVASGVPANHDHVFNVTAVFDGANGLTGCNSLGGTVPSAFASADHAIRSGPPLAPASTGPSGSHATSSSAAKKSPGFAVPAVAVALAVLAIARRRL